MQLAEARAKAQARTAAHKRINDGETAAGQSDNPELKKRLAKLGERVERLAKYARARDHGDKISRELLTTCVEVHFEESAPDAGDALTLSWEVGSAVNNPATSEQTIGGTVGDVEYVAATWKMAAAPEPPLERFSVTRESLSLNEAQAATTLAALENVMTGAEEELAEQQAKAQSIQA